MDNAGLINYTINRSRSEMLTMLLWCQENNIRLYRETPHGDVRDMPYEGRDGCLQFIRGFSNQSLVREFTFKVSEEDAVMMRVRFD